MSAVVGIVMVLVGVLLTFVGNAWNLPGAWHMPATRTDLQHGVYSIAAALFCCTLLTSWIRAICRGCLTSTGWC